MKGRQYLCSCNFLITSDSEEKMGDELTLLLEVFHKIEKAGGQATLSASTAGGKSKFKLEVATSAAPPSVSPSTSSTSGRRHRRRGARARARRNQRAAAHQASLAEAATGVPLDPPRPLQLHPSPPPASGRRQVMSVGRLDMPSFSSLNLDGSTSPTPVPPSPPPPPVCYDDCNPVQHCETCRKCEFLCIEHSGCDCDPDQEEFEDDLVSCPVCHCIRGVRHADPKRTLHEPLP